MKAQIVASITLLGGLLVSEVLAEKKPPLPEIVSLPDGQEFKTWEPSLKFLHTYYVAQSHPRASDDNAGTEALPFKTINRAAQLLQPGQRVVVAAGIYRERVQPARGGTGPDQMISYEAAPGATVIISGSVVVEEKWRRLAGSENGGATQRWTIKLPDRLFSGENPFAQLNLSDEQIDKCMDWAVSTKGKAPNTLRRGLIFLNGQRLRQVTTDDELATTNGSYRVEKDGLTIHLNLPGSDDPNRAQIEITTRGMILAPQAFGLGYIRVKGFVIEHSGNCFPRPQQGALSTLRGHHWIIEENRVRQCNSIGIDIGGQFAISGLRPAEGGQHIVRRNMVADCGIGGIEGTGIEHTLIEENHISRCGWQRAQYIWETGGIKVHNTVSTLVRANFVQDSIDAPGIWMDYANRNSRCTKNVVIGTESVKGGIFMEASQSPNLVDRNVVWGSTTNGIYQHDCDELIIAHNLVAHCKDAGIRMLISEGRMVGGRLATAKRNRILNNIFVDNGQSLAISDPENVSDGNLFGATQQPFDLTKWRHRHGWDQSSTAAEIHASFDYQTLALNWSVRGETPKCRMLPSITVDFFRLPYPSKLGPPGPFETVPSSPTRVFLGVK